MISKSLSKRVLPIMCSYISPEQHGFTPGRTAAEATTFAQTIIKDAIAFNKPLQIISFDAKSAFDRVKFIAVRQMLNEANINIEFIDAWLGLTEGGLAQVSINGLLSDLIKLLDGTGQGDNSSTIKYNLVHELILKLYKLLDFPFKYVVRNLPVPLLAYADDLHAYTKLSSTQDYLDLLSFLITLKQSQVSN